MKCRKPPLIPAIKMPVSQPILVLSLSPKPLDPTANTGFNNPSVQILNEVAIWIISPPRQNAPATMPLEKSTAASHGSSKPGPRSACANWAGTRHQPWHGQRLSRCPDPQGAGRGTQRSWPMASDCPNAAIAAVSGDEYCVHGMPNSNSIEGPHTLGYIGS